MLNNNSALALIAAKASMTCFLNSLLREWFDWTVDDKCQIVIVTASGNLIIPLQRYSKAGRHQYLYPAYYENKAGTVPMGFDELYKNLIAYIETSQTTAHSKATFSRRVLDSIQVIEDVLEFRFQDFTDGTRTPQTFIEAEQQLIIGHSFHPSPKSREGFTADDRLRFCPELKGKFPLAWFAVDPTLIYKRSSKSFDASVWVNELVESDPQLSTYDSAFDLYPMHPWQARHLLTLPSVKAHIDAGKIQFLGEHGESWFPTSSVRSIYRETSPYMLKTSLSVRLTNSVRNLLIKEVDRGLQVHDVFQSTHGQNLLKDYPTFKVLFEPAYWALLDTEGKPIDESIVVCRENPFQKGADQAFVLATLTQDNPFQELTAIGLYVKNYANAEKIDEEVASIAWFEAYLTNVLEPFLMAQAEYGILLGAHQQNILVTIKGHLPSGVTFRDCQGTGYSEHGYAKLKDEITSFDIDNGNILPNDMAHILFVYYLIINATFNVISTLGQNSLVSEDDLIAKLRLKIEHLLKREPKDPSCLKHLLSSPKIMHKGNFLCSIQDINENTSENPLAIYTAIDNPLVRN